MNSIMYRVQKHRLAKTRENIAQNQSLERHANVNCRPENEAPLNCGWAGLLDEINEQERQLDIAAIDAGVSDDEPSRQDLIQAATKLSEELHHKLAYYERLVDFICDRDLIVPTEIDDEEVGDVDEVVNQLDFRIGLPSWTQRMAEASGL